MKRSLSFWLLAIIALAILACTVQPPIYTPSAPQQTAGALNATYEARATVSALPVDQPTPTATPRPTAAPATLTPDLPVEVTPNVTPQGPQEVGTPLGAPMPPGVIKVERGVYVSAKGQRVRTCESVICGLAPYQLSSGKAYPTEGWVINEDFERWVCLSIDESHGPAQLCEEAAAWIIGTTVYGDYEKTN